MAENRKRFFREPGSRPEAGPISAGQRQQQAAGRNRPYSLAALLLPILVGCTQFDQSAAPNAAETATLKSLTENGSKDTKSVRHQPDATRAKKRQGAQLDSADEQFMNARRLERAGNIQQAIQQYSSLNASYPQFWQAQQRLAVLYDKSGDFQKSAELYQTATKLAPADGGLLSDHGYSRYVQGDLAGAEQLLRKAIEVQPTLKRAHNNLALLLVAQGKDDEAIAHFQQVSVDPRAAQQMLKDARDAARLSVPESEKAATPAAS